MHVWTHGEHMDGCMDGRMDGCVDGCWIGLMDGGWWLVAGGCIVDGCMDV